ncbi:hypothetical protein Dimus_036673, partial [Dionaea muscipula]
MHFSRTVAVATRRARLVAGPLPRGPAARKERAAARASGAASLAARAHVLARRRRWSSCSKPACSPRGDEKLTSRLALPLAWRRKM